MGYNTDFVGHIDIHPHLNEHEQAYLSTFSDTRRWARPGGSYAVPANPVADEATQGSYSVDRRMVAEGQPGFSCGWTPCWDGCCLGHDGVEKFYQSTRWMTYLIDHFLKPGAFAADSGLDCFEHFTFDHRLDGIVAACRRDTKELFLIRVEDSLVAEEILRSGDPDYEGWPPLAHEEFKDQWEPPRKRRARATGERAKVMPLRTVAED